jgi:hypothetical protein
LLSPIYIYIYASCFTLNVKNIKKLSKLGVNFNGWGLAGLGTGGQFCRCGGEGNDRG